MELNLCNFKMRPYLKSLHRATGPLEWPSTNEVWNSRVYKYIKDSGHNVECHNVIIVDREKQWHKHGIKEAVWERIKQPTLNKRGEGLCFNLSHTWNFMVFLVASHMTTPRSQLPKED